jgi:hypothetical protein
LFTLAVVDPDQLKYTQGMNFIAGFLYLFLRDEAKSFQVMKQVIERNGMSQMFDTNKLKRSFYMLDRIL